MRGESRTSVQVRSPRACGEAMSDIVAPMAGSAHSLAKECFRQRIRHGGRPGDPDASASDSSGKFDSAVEIVGRSKHYEFIKHRGGFNGVVASGCSSIGEKERDATRRRGPRKLGGCGAEREREVGRAKTS